MGIEDLVKGFLTNIAKAKLFSDIWAAGKSLTLVVEDDSDVRLHAALTLRSIPLPMLEIGNIFVHPTGDHIPYADFSVWEFLSGPSRDVFLGVKASANRLNNQLGIYSLGVVMELSEILIRQIPDATGTLGFENFLIERIEGDLHFRLVTQSEEYLLILGRKFEVAISQPVYEGPTSGKQLRISSYGEEVGMKSALPFPIKLEAMYFEFRCLIDYLNRSLVGHHPALKRKMFRVRVVAVPAPHVAV